MVMSAGKGQFNLTSPWPVIIAAIFLCGHASARLYTNQIAVIVYGDVGTANYVAKQHGFVNTGQIGSLEHHYIFEHPEILTSASPSYEHLEKLERDDRVAWFQQQHVLIRTQRAVTNSPTKEVGKEHAKRDPRKDPGFTLNDPLWYKQRWYLNRTRNESYFPDMNVVTAWKMGYSGRGVVVTILNDGIEKTHSDLRENYDATASYDYIDRGDYTSPGITDKFGTRCAGVVAAVANNSHCGIGIAFNAHIGGIRMIDGDVTDAIEAASLSHNRQHIDIYSASWGPADDGVTLAEPGVLTKKALIQGITQGRGGKGSIFIWASGSGGYNDSCSCDGYSSSPYTMSITSTTENLFKPLYTEECPSIMATTFDSGEPVQGRIVTTDVNNECTTDLTGTSSSSPIAAGIIALVLEANPMLNWRDVQHITQRNARPIRYSRRNGAGIAVSSLYGFGLMDATGMVLDAIKWTNVPEQLTTRVHAANGGFISHLVHQSFTKIRYLEHVQVQLNMTSPRRSQLSITLRSPSGMESTLLSNRPNDWSDQGFQDWTFMSVHFWGEDPIGYWTLNITDEMEGHSLPNSGWIMTLHGTSENPATAIQHPQSRSTTHVPIWNSTHTKHQPSWSPYAFNWTTAAMKTSATTKYPYPHNVTRGTAPRYTTTTASPKMSTVADVSPWPRWCHPECGRGCYGSGNNQCYSCAHVRINGSCVPSCPERFFANKLNVCLPCHSTCQTCLGPGARNCTTCLGDLLKDVHRRLCVFVCPPDYYQGYNYCAKCAPGLSLINEECVREEPGRCKDGEYFNVLNTECSPCHAHCAKCTGPTEANCLECSSGMGYHEGSDSCKYCCASESSSCCICDEYTDTCLSTGAQDAKVQLDTGIVILIVGLLCILIVTVGVATALLLRCYRPHMCSAVTSGENEKDGDKLAGYKAALVYTIVPDVEGAQLGDRLEGCVPISPSCPEKCVRVS